MQELVIYNTPGRLRCIIPGCMNFAEKAFKKKAGPITCICNECLSVITAKLSADLPKEDTPTEVQETPKKKGATKK